MTAGDRKIPDPIVDPTSTAMALKSPSRRGREEGGETAEDMGGQCKAGRGQAEGARTRRLPKLPPPCEFSPGIRPAEVHILTPSLPSAIFWVSVAICAVAQLAILLSAFRTAGRSANSDVPRPARISEIAWTIVPAIGLAIVLTGTWQAISYQAAVAAASAHAMPMDAEADAHHDH